MSPCDTLSQWHRRPACAFPTQLRTPIHTQLLRIHKVCLRHAIPLPSLTTEQDHEGDSVPVEREAQRARILRSRAVWYCIAGLFLVGLSFCGLLSDIKDEVHPDGTPIVTMGLDATVDALIALLFTGAMVYIINRRPSRRHLVFVLSVLIVLASGVLIFNEITSIKLNPPYVNNRRPLSEAALQMFSMSLLVFALLQSFASAFIPMSWRESLRIVIPCWLVYTVEIFLLVPHPIRVGHFLFSLLFFPIVALPGMAFSAWRFREIDEKLDGQELKEKFDEVTAELAHARRIHEALFPPTIHRGPIRLTYRYEPMREIGGDFLFVHPLAPPPAETQSVMNVVLIDVSGHGVPAALAVNRLHGELQRVFADEPDISPGDLLAQLNRYACAALSAQGVFATVLCLRVDSTRGELTWASAGHPPAFLRRPGAEVIELSPTAIMLGVLESDAFEASEQRVDLGLADVILAYTDGAPETRDAKKQDFGIHRVHATVSRGSKMGKLAESLMTAVTSHRHGRIADDTLIVEIVHVGGELGEWSRGQSGVLTRGTESR